MDGWQFIANPAQLAMALRYPTLRGTVSNPEAQLP
jgi:hypothetical protein